MRTPLMPWFRKHHTCPCGTDWWDEWNCLCNDRCPTCDAEIEPDEHEAIQGAKSAKTQNPPIPRGCLPPGAIKGFDKQRVSLWFQDAGLPLSRRVSHWQPAPMKSMA